VRDRPFSTLLELKIRERGMTLDEFVQHAEEFAREHGERGTISARHLQRLISPRVRPTSLRPATRRLLEAIFATPAVELLGPPATTTTTTTTRRCCLACRRAVRVNRRCGLAPGVRRGGAPGRTVGTGRSRGVGPLCVASGAVARDGCSSQHSLRC
jgi:hypothetical protein